MTDSDERRDGPFARFTVVTEPMPDGRSIHYYEWPDDEDRPAGSGPSGEGEGTTA